MGRALIEYTLARDRWLWRYWTPWGWETGCELMPNHKKGGGP